MFEDVDDDQRPEIKPNIKKMKFNESETIHSSLKHHTIKAPPLVEYNKIENYCEKKRGESLLPHSDKPPTSSSNNLENLSSPIIFKTPKPPVKPVVLHEHNKPYVFFSVEELSLVKCLKNWSNTKVTAVGKPVLHPSSQVYHLCSVGENGRWELRLDTTLLKQDPDPNKLLQILGIIEVKNGEPRVKVNFFRHLGNADLSRLVESYKMISQFIPETTISRSDNPTKELDISLKKSSDDGFRLNDTLDCFDFSNFL